MGKRVACGQCCLSTAQLTEASLSTVFSTSSHERHERDSIELDTEDEEGREEGEEEEEEEIKFQDEVAVLVP